MNTQQRKELDCLKEMWDVKDDFQCMRIFCQAHYIMRRNLPSSVREWNSFKTEEDCLRVYKIIMDELFNPSEVEKPILDICSLRFWNSNTDGSET